MFGYFDNNSDSLFNCDFGNMCILYNKNTNKNDRGGVKMFPELTEQEHQELVDNIRQFFLMQRRKTEIRRTLIFYGVIFVIIILLVIWIL